MSYEILAEALRYPEGDPEKEDLYIRTFDIHAICFLEVGYVLFGEDYKRGHLLVKLHEVLKEFGIDPRGELADHLPTLLELLPKLRSARPEEAEALVEKIIFPALEKMLQGFAKGGNPYAEPLKAVREVLERDYPGCRGAAPAPGPGARLIPLPAYRNDEMTGDAYDG
jgi:nitrate reductase assembly molybdenum cofactor insertion protein NarJ